MKEISGRAARRAARRAATKMTGWDRPLPMSDPIGIDRARESAPSRYDYSLALQERISLLSC